MLRAFANVCRHRAAPVATEPCGQASRLRCRYHGWTYDLAGRLRGAPEFDGVADFRREDNGLPALAVAVWGPWVWVHAGDQPADAPRHPRSLADALPGPTLEAPAFVARGTTKSPATGRCTSITISTAATTSTRFIPAWPACWITPITARVYGWTSVQISPLKAADAADATARTRTGDAAQYWWVYPHFMVNLYQGVMDTNLVLPLGPDRCRVVFDFYFAETEGAEAEAFVRDSMAVADRIQQEDMQICEQVQRGLGSRSYTAGLSVRRENGGYHFHQLLGTAAAGSIPFS